MTKYISKDALVAEIENRIYRRKKEYNILEESEIWEDALKLKERINELVDLRTQILFNTLDTLEVKEVDLEKELSYDDYMNFFKEHPDFPDDWGFDESWIFAEYFYKLGIKAQRGE